MASEQPTNNWVNYIDTLMAYHLGIDASSMNDARWTETYAQLVHITEQEAKALRHRR